MSDSELTVILERYKKDFVTLNESIRLIKDSVYRGELLQLTLENSALSEELDEVYESIVGDNGRERFTHEEFVQCLLDTYDYSQKFLDTFKVKEKSNE